MKKIILSMLLFVSACSSNAKNRKNQYLVLNDLWEKRSTKTEVIKSLGDGFKEVDSGIIYTYPNSNRPRIGLFFDSSNKLREQFVFLQEADLQEFKKAMDCKWKETEEVKAIAHYHRTIKKGSCSELAISYETYLDLNAYELRWR